MRNFEVCRRFARGEEGKGSHLAAVRLGFSRGLALFSYDEPIALNVGGRIVTSDHKYSMTTTRHQTELRNALIMAGAEYTDACRTRIRRMAGLPDRRQRVTRRGRHTYRDGVRVQPGAGGPGVPEVT